MKIKIASCGYDLSFQANKPLHIKVDYVLQISPRLITPETITKIIEAVQVIEIDADDQPDS